nr:radical SAM protein [Candidatus Gracilibacteria bacterium]
MINKYSIFKGFYLYTLLPFERETYIEYNIKDLINDYKDVINSGKRIDIYLHIPWCNDICDYCHCNKTKYNKNEISLFLKKLEEIMEYYFITYGKIDISALWIGGGTPNILSYDEMERLFKLLYKYFNFKDGFVHTIELNHLYLNNEKVDLIKNYGFDMVKIPIQSVNENIIKDVNRFKGKGYIDKYVNIINYVKSKNFKEVSSDMILGLPGSTLEDEINTFKFLKSIDIDNICVFPLQMTVYGKKISKDMMVNTYNNIIERYYEFINQISTDTDYYMYNEKVFSTAFFLIRNNHKYLEDKKYHFNHFYEGRSVIGLGPTAVGNVFGKEYYINFDLDKYNTKNNVKKYNITIRDEMLYYIFYGLDLYGRVSLEGFNLTFGENLSDVFLKEISMGLKKNILSIEGNFIKVIEKNRYVLFLYLFNNFLNETEKKSFIKKSLINNNGNNNV